MKNNDYQSTGKSKPEEEKFEIKYLDTAFKDTHQPKNRLILWASLLFIAVVIIAYFIAGGKKNSLNAIVTGNSQPIKEVKIGNQVWMAENLKTTRLNDGTPIPKVTNNSEWNSLLYIGYCFYDNDEATYKATYGALYNWNTVNTGKLCPTGWHVPSDTEWTTLINFLGGDSIAGYKLKDTGTVHWNSPNTGATNVSGFTALPGGYRYFDGTFHDIGTNGFWWSSTWSSTFNEDIYRAMSFRDGAVYVVNEYSGLPSIRVGLSVRCIKDN
jgi:uncharacterized protein (TIGR02145 family)